MKTGRKMKGKRILYGLVGALLILALSAVVGRGARTQAAAVDETLLLAVENAAGQDPAAAASRVFAAESSRSKAIRDSIEASISLEQSVAESKAEANRLLLESIRAAGEARESRAASIAEYRFGSPWRNPLRHPAAQPKRRRGRRHPGLRRKRQPEPLQRQGRLRKPLPSRQKARSSFSATQGRRAS